MDEIKSIISQLPSQDIIVIKTLYNPEGAKSELSENGQRMIAIIDGLSPEEQQEAVNITSEEVPVEEAIPQETDQGEMPQGEMPQGEMPVEEERPNPAGNLEDFLI